MRLTSKEFANDPCNSSKRNTMIDAARVLLTVVTKLLCIADMADVYRLLATLSIVCIQHYAVDLFSESCSVRFHYVFIARQN